VGGKPNCSSLAVTALIAEERHPSRHETPHDLGIGLTMFVSDRTRRGILARVRRIAILLALIALFEVLRRPSLPFPAGVIPDPDRTRDSNPSLAELAEFFPCQVEFIPCQVEIDSLQLPCYRGRVFPANPEFMACSRGGGRGSSVVCHPVGLPDVSRRALIG
jgi:hypothetical protein